jgi:hypothetical protein
MLDPRGLKEVTYAVYYTFFFLLQIIEDVDEEEGQYQAHRR